MEKTKAKENKTHLMEGKPSKKNITPHIIRGVLLYVFFSICVSLFFDDILFGMFLATAGVTAWVMQGITQHKKNNEQHTSYTFSNKAWYSLLSPLFGSLLLQSLYFAGLGKPLNLGFFLGWVFSNWVLTLVFSLIGAVGMYLYLMNKQRKDQKKK